MATNRAVRDADAPAAPTEPDAQRRTVLAAIGRLIVAAYERWKADQHATEGGDDDG